MIGEGSGEARRGVLAIVAACAIWGFAPLYYHGLREVPALEMMAHRTLWTGLIFGAAAWFSGRGGEVKALLTGRDRWRLLAAALLIGFNWLLFIWAVASGAGVEASLGYYIYPLVSAALGAALFGERLRGAQAAAIGVAVLAVAVLTWGLGVVPKVSLALAVSFAAYAAVKRGMDAGALAGVLAEVLVIGLPLGLWLAWLWITGQGWFGRDLWHSLMLPLAGPLSGGPLVLFSYGARRVRLATSGLVQYMNPTIQFFSAWLVLMEPVTPWHGLALALIWLAIGLYAWGARGQASAAARPATSTTRN